MLRTISALLGAPLLMLAMTGCTDVAATDVTLTKETIILDVRTPGEYAGGHLEGAKLLDFNSGELAASLPELSFDAEYVVYCRSGNRSGQALKLMEEAGFTSVTDLGSLEQAAEATTLPIVS